MARGTHECDNPMSEKTRVSYNIHSLLGQVFQVL
jgi:hypothetical protein